MLRPIMTGMLVTVERRGLVEVLPEDIRKWWKKWQLRYLVIFSLFLQISLVFLGKLRKRNGKPWLRFSVWSAYLLADLVATVGLGAISNRVQERPNTTAPLVDDLFSFWATFLLLHLGGPDTITAYSLEDNQLWHRRLLELVIQTLVVGYIFLITWPSFSALSVLTIPMLIIGLIKFLERIFSLRSASTEHFRLSLMSEPDPGPNYFKFMEEFTMKKAEGFYVRALKVTETRLPTRALISEKNEELVIKAYNLFQTFKRLFADLILSFQDRDESQCYFHNIGHEQAFEVIEIELGLAYDVFYTKAPVVYSVVGIISRLLTFFTTLSSLVAFSFICRSKKDPFHTIDLIITYLLFVVAILLEICSSLIFLFSDWSDYYCRNCIISSFRHLFWAPKKRWSNLIAQCSIQNFCQEEKSTTWPRVLKFLMAENKVDEIWHLTYNEVASDLKEMIFNQFLEISRCSDNSNFTSLCMSRGNHVVEDKELDCSDLNWSITKVEFDQSILLWHIATDLCYHSEKDFETSISGKSKQISEYMLHLLVMCPHMLPMGIGMIRFRDTCAEAWEFFKEKREKPNRINACKMLLRVNTEIQPGKVKGDRSKSVLFDACRLATQLRSMDCERRWKIMNRVWVEILAYAACHCRGNQHAQQLRKGGEFFTHVWLLMAHLGITEQFQIYQGHARAKLYAK